MVIQNRHRTFQYQDGTYISQYNSVSKGLYIAQIPVLQIWQQQKHFGRFNKMESRIGLRHMLFEQNVALPSLTSFPLTLKCHIVMVICYIMIL